MKKFNLDKKHLKILRMIFIMISGFTVGYSGLGVANTLFWLSLLYILFMESEGRNQAFLERYVKENKIDNAGKFAVSFLKFVPYLYTLGYIVTIHLCGDYIIRWNEENKYFIDCNFKYLIIICCAIILLMIGKKTNAISSDDYKKYVKKQGKESLKDFSNHEGFLFSKELKNTYSKETLEYAISLLNRTFQRIETAKKTSYPCVYKIFPETNEAVAYFPDFRYEPEIIPTANETELLERAKTVLHKHIASYKENNMQLPWASNPCKDWLKEDNEMIVNISSLISVNKRN